MILTRDQFRRSCFYPASASDLNPLLRFSNLTNTFICPTLKIPRDDILSSIKQATARLNRWNPGVLELVGEPRPFSASDLDVGPVSTSMGDFLDPHEQRIYWNTFGVDTVGPLWGMELTFVRRIGESSRHLRVLYFSGEGLASYVALSHQGQFAPLILCTVRSGVMENPTGVIPRLMREHATKPAIWVRGSEGREIRGGPYPHRVQRYHNWFAFDGSWLRPQTAAFTSGDRCLGLQEDVTLEGGNGRKVRLVRSRLRPEQVGDFDAAILSPGIADRWGNVAPREKLVVLRTPHGGLQWQPWDSMIPPLLLGDALNQIDHLALTHGWRRLVMLPVGYEDEGIAVRQWVNRPGPPVELELRFYQELDFADLRGFQNGFEA
jgi:hypothetical protein